MSEICQLLFNPELDLFSKRKEEKDAQIIPDRGIEPRAAA
jgi:hypothetical protein